jgi:2-polyprenyl-6-methoxyphenol hydroxylase-like FAD-dependent oxidoreductase
VVVGAGPAGCAISLLLARAGIPVTLVEAEPRLSSPFRGEALMPSGFEALERLGFPCLPATVPQRSLKGWRVLVEGQTLLEVPEPIGPGPACTLVAQEELLATLLAQASANPCFKRRQGVRVAGLRREGSRIAGVTMANGDCLVADLVVACDGRGSLLREQAGLPLQLAPSQHEVLWFLLAAEAVAEIRDWLGGTFLTVLGAGNGFALFETAADRNLRLGWLCRPGDDQDLSPGEWLERLTQTCAAPLAPWLRQLPTTALQGPLRVPIQVGLARRWHQGGFLLLGDGAHPLSPVRAQGLNMAFRDAVVAAEELVPALLQGGAPTLDAALPGIERRRHPELRRIQALQAAESSSGELLRSQGWLRQLLAAQPSLFSPLMTQIWLGRQRQLRQGLPLGSRSGVP